MTSCDRIIPLFSLHVEGEASPAEDALIRGHLVDCPECRQELTDLKATLALLHGLPAVEAPDGFEAQVLLRLNEVRAVASREAEATNWERDDIVTPGGPTVLVIENRWWEHWIPRFAATAAAAAVVALALVGGQRMLWPGSAPGVGFADRTGSVPTEQAGSGVDAATVRAGSRASESAGSVLDGGGSSLADAGASVAARSSDVISSADSPSDSRRFDDLRSLFPDIPPEVIRAMPMNGETFASDRLVARPGSPGGDTQILAPVEYRSAEPVYIYR